MDDKRFQQVELEDGQHKLSITKVRVVWKMIDYNPNLRFLNLMKE